MDSSSRSDEYMHPYDTEDTSNSLEFYNNYTEIRCSTLVSKKASKATGKELIMQEKDAMIKANSHKWAKAFSLNSETLLTVTIQGNVVELTLKNLFSNVGGKSYDALKKYSGADKHNEDTNRYVNLDFEILQEAWVESVYEGNELYENASYSVFYVSKNLDTLF
jgi:hypothetical protein